MINSYGLALVAGAPGRIVSAGAFFSLQTGSGVDVSFIRNGSVIGKASNQNAGFYARSKQGEEFDEVMLLSATPQNVAVLIGENEAGAAATVALSGTASVSVVGTAGVSGDSVSVFTGTVHALFLAANPARKFLMMGNTSSVNDLRFSFGASSTVGFFLPPKSVMIMDRVVPTGDIYARHSGASGILAVEVLEG